MLLIHWTECFSDFISEKFSSNGTPDSHVDLLDRWQKRRWLCDSFSKVREWPWVSSVIPNCLPTMFAWKTALQLNCCGKKICLYRELSIKKGKAINDILSQVWQNEFSRLLLIIWKACFPFPVGNRGVEAFQFWFPASAGNSTFQDHSHLRWAAASCFSHWNPILVLILSSSVSRPNIFMGIIFLVLFNCPLVSIAPVLFL